MTNACSFTIRWCLTAILWATCLVTAHAAERDEIIFFFNDTQGSAVAAVSEQGELCWSEVYTPYGDKTINDDLVNPTGCGIVGEERGFTGHTEDVNSDLVYMQQRYYDPSIGRFLSIDPRDVDPNDSQTLNRYAYANNNPYKYVDPDGEFAFLIPVAAFVAKEVVAEFASRATGGLTDVLSARRMAGKAVKSGLKSVGKDGAKSSKGVGPHNLGGAGTLAVTKGGGTVIGRIKDLQKINKGEKSLLDRLPNQGSPKANWKKNSDVLRQEMGKGKPIRDASPGDTSGQYLNAERNLLESRGWAFDKSTNYWNPPK